MRSDGVRNRNRPAAGVGLRQQWILGDPFRVEIKVREHRAVVAAVAPDIVERLKPALLLRGQRGDVARAEAIERTVHRHQPALEGGDGVADPPAVNRRAGSEGFLEQRDVLGNRPDPRDNGVHRRRFRIGMCHAFLRAP